MKSPFLLAALALLAACSSAIVTPQGIRNARIPQAERDDLVQTWEAAVSRCNEFLASPFRHALPPGRITLDEAQGMRFESEFGNWPLEVRCTPWGDVVQFFGFWAQEGRGGFTVGDCEPERDRMTDNAMFFSENGFRHGSDSIADLILHEGTHVLFDEGAIGFWKSAGYYLETIFLFRYGRTHSDERRSYSTGEEFHAFIQSVGRSQAERDRLLAELEKHIAQADWKCRHQGMVKPAS